MYSLYDYIISQDISVSSLISLASFITLSIISKIFASSNVDKILANLEYTYYSSSFKLNLLTLFYMGLYIEFKLPSPGGNRLPFYIFCNSPVADCFYCEFLLADRSLPFPPIDKLG